MCNDCYSGNELTRWKNALNPPRANEGQFVTISGASVVSPRISYRMDTGTSTW